MRIAIKPPAPPAASVQPISIPTPSAPQPTSPPSDRDVPPNPAGSAAPNTAWLLAPERPPAANCICVSTRQRGNPLLGHIHIMKTEFARVIPDFVLGRATCALFLSLQYHMLHPQYLRTRLAELGPHFYRLKVVLCYVDVQENIGPSLEEITLTTINFQSTLILAWSLSEAGQYLEMYRAFEDRSAESIQGKSDEGIYSKV
ncbi:putative DNA excision repair protein ERCC-1 [Paratrimastix pyriformis]|uniref:DNA excision repair protein ERCC-1 n=1 Tax=Paratrimastix pyriformis TaxID=342808 RepID=A0ABQ8UQJ1_9EUKA|nr:putative DNA excision repair protein ERCC-1 [Paratrimastix pyriformis]